MRVLLLFLRLLHPSSARSAVGSSYIHGRGAVHQQLCGDLDEVAAASEGRATSACVRTELT